MGDATALAGLVDTRNERHGARRDFFRAVTAAGIGAAALGLGAGRAVAQAAPSDADVLNFALNLEYLEANFYLQAAFGEGLPGRLREGAGTEGDAEGGGQVDFSDSLVRNYAREIAMDERAHVEFLRGALGTAAIAQPAIDIDVGPNTAFSVVARAAGLIGANEEFDPYENDENFLLAAFLLEDVGVAAYKGAAVLINSPAFLEAAAGILAVEAYHAATIRTTLYAKGIETPALIDATEAISRARDGLDGSSDRDQGIAPINGVSNIAPLDADGIAFGRSAAETLNIVYLSGAAVSAGGFFPQGVNGAIRTSAATA